MTDDVSPEFPRPLRVLAMICASSDTATFDSARAFQELQSVLAPAIATGSVQFELLATASESELRRALTSPWHVAVVIANGQENAAARLATLSFVGSDGNARAVTAQSLGALFAAQKALRLVLVCPGADGSAPLRVTADAIAKRGVPAVIAAGFSFGRKPIAPQFVSWLLAALADGVDVRRLATFAPTAHTWAAWGVYVAVAETTTALWRRAVASASMPVQPPHDAVAAAPASAAEAATHKLALKRAASAFDVFLCHNGDDKPAVKAIAKQLQDNGILPWLDEWELPPGQPWQALLENQIANIKSAAVFVGAAGIGPWQEAELRGFLTEFRSRGCPVIPVVLPNAPEKPALPLFLKEMTWVDFRRYEPVPLAHLIWGITGERTEL